MLLPHLDHCEDLHSLVNEHPNNIILWEATTLRLSKSTKAIRCNLPTESLDWNFIAAQSAYVVIIPVVVGAIVTPIVAFNEGTDGMKKVTVYCEQSKMLKMSQPAPGIYLTVCFIVHSWNHL